MSGLGKNLMEPVLHTLKAPGKGLRPYLVLNSCGAAGGNPEDALPLAAAVELYHTFMLVHDDIIDGDGKRRSRESVHARWSRIAREKYGYDEVTAKQFGISVGIVAGDVLRGWAIGGMLTNSSIRNADAQVGLELIRELDFVTMQALAAGEANDVANSGRDIRLVTEREIVQVLWQKTASLYHFCALGGAMIGLGQSSKKSPIASNLARFAGQCGIAFQIKDDILGLIGKEKETGKPIGSDLRQGKKTIAIVEAFKLASRDERKIFEAVLGNPSASKDEIASLTELTVKLGGIEYAENVARTYLWGGEAQGREVIGAFEYLDRVNRSDSTESLREWALFLAERRV